MKKILGGTILLILMTVLAGCYNTSSTAGISDSTTPLPAVTPTGQVKEFSVSGTEYSFSPSSITVNAGDQVRITFKNNGRAIHNLIIEGLGVGTKTIGVGQADIVEFIAPASGTYTFFCSVSGHRAAGMEGSLKVE